MRGSARRVVRRYAWCRRNARSTNFTTCVSARGGIPPVNASSGWNCREVVVVLLSKGLASPHTRQKMNRVTGVLQPALISLSEGVPEVWSILWCSRKDIETSRQRPDRE